MDTLVDLLARLDATVDAYEFPLWECGIESAVVAAMRMSGFVANQGVALVFETFEYQSGDGCIASVASCITTFPITGWLHRGDSIQLNVRKSEQGVFPFDFGTLQVSSRGREFSIPLERDDLIRKRYLSSESSELTAEAILLQIGDIVPRDWLFSKADFLINIFDMGHDFHRLFVVENWQHPTFDDLYEAGIKPSESPDIRAIAEALCAGDSLPRLVGEPNTSWEIQCCH